jgi:putative heme-binding domain-containing protein
LRAAPGTRVALAFHNQDPGMPHNVAIVRAVDIDAFGEAAMMLASNPRAIATHYVPNEPAEICFSPILPPGDQYTMYFEAPAEPGEYRLVCTYPGHWRVMQGSLYVLADDAPLPESAFAPVRKFVRMWTVEDLGDAADALSQRSFASGRAAFESAGCIKCHRIANEGVTLGPELTKVSERFSGRKLLQQILEPSTEINKQYQSWSAVLTDGRVVTGLMTAQDASSMTLLPNPLKPDLVETVQRAEIDELLPSEVSTMPGSLLMTYTRDEILDLLAFVQSGGDASHAVFAP